MTNGQFGESDLCLRKRLWSLYDTRGFREKFTFARRIFRRSADFRNISELFLNEKYTGDAFYTVHSLRAIRFYTISPAFARFYTFYFYLHNFFILRVSGIFVFESGDHPNIQKYRIQLSIWNCFCLILYYNLTRVLYSVVNQLWLQRSETKIRYDLFIHFNQIKLFSVK